jgi:hypothetical protein
VVDLNGKMEMKDSILRDTSTDIYGRECNALKGGRLEIDET